MSFYDRVSKSLCQKMCFIYLQNSCFKTFCTSLIFPKLEISVERSSGSKWSLLQGEVFKQACAFCAVLSSVQSTMVIE